MLETGLVPSDSVAAMIATANGWLGSKSEEMLEVFLYVIPSNNADASALVMPLMTDNLNAVPSSARLDNLSWPLTI